MSIIQNESLYGAIDLGSNSFHLLVAEWRNRRLVTIDREREYVRLARGLQDDKTLDKASRQRALECAHRFAERVRGIPPGNLRVVGTNTFRIAHKNRQFVRELEEILGVPLEVVSGNEEARLVYLGVSSDFHHLDGMALVVDIGGGSTEVILGDREPIAMESLPMGCVSFSAQYFPNGKITPQSYRKAVLAAETEIQPMLEAFSHYRISRAVGSSGSIRALGRILQQRQSGNPVITRDGLEKLAREWCEAGNVSGFNNDDVSAERREVLPGGLAVLHAVFDALDLREMDVSEYTMKEGIIYEMVGKTAHHGRREKTIKSMMDQYHVDKGQVARVQEVIDHLLPQVGGQLTIPEQEARDLLHWAACLHEIGLSLSHSGYHKHSAYIVENTDMPGFSQRNQRLVAFIITNHRKKLKMLPDYFPEREDWVMVAIFRVACLLCRRRIAVEWPDIELKTVGKRIELALPREWLAEHPLTAEDMEREQECWSKLEQRLLVTAQ